MLDWKQLSDGSRRMFIRLMSSFGQADDSGKVIVPDERLSEMWAIEAYTLARRLGDSVNG